MRLNCHVFPRLVKSQSQTQNCLNFDRFSKSKLALLTEDSSVMSGAIKVDKKTIQNQETKNQKKKQETKLKKQKKKRKALMKS